MAVARRLDLMGREARACLVQLGPLRPPGSFAGVVLRRGVAPTDGTEAESKRMPMDDGWVA